MKKGLNRSAIDTYLKTSDTSAKLTLEERLLEDDFERDALDGFLEAGVDTSVMRKLDRRFAPKTFFGWIIGATSLILIAIVYFLMIPAGKTSSDQSSSKKARLVKIDKTEVVLPVHIDTLSERPIRSQIKAKELAKDFTEQKELEKAEEPFTPIKLEPKEMPKVASENSENARIENRQVSGKEIYLYDMKLLDYRAYRSKPKIKTEQLILTGIPADHESGSSSQESEWQTIEVPYIDYIERSMALFSKGNYKKALGRFEVILITFPNDINALFYAGLCYYNLKSTNAAIQSFEKCLDSEYSNFKEESEWYYCLGLIESGESDRAKITLKRIVASNGFYAEQAKRKLNAL